MWIYEKILEYPVKVYGSNPRLARLILSQYGGPDGELSAALRYLNQRYTMPTGMSRAVLTDIGTEELAHMEIIAALYYNLIKDATIEQIDECCGSGYYADHGKSIYFANASGVPWQADYVQSKGDPIADLHDNMAAEQRARVGYEYLIQMSDDRGVTDALQFLREREVVHYQRFGETLEHLYEYYGKERYFFMNGK